MQTIREPTKAYEHKYDLECHRCKAVMRCSLGELAIDAEDNKVFRAMKCPHCTYRSQFSAEELRECRYEEPVL